MVIVLCKMFGPHSRFVGRDGNLEDVCFVYDRLGAFVRVRSCGLGSYEHDLCDYVS